MALTSEFLSAIGAEGLGSTLARVTAERTAVLKSKPLAELGALMAALPERKAKIFDFSRSEVVIGEDLAPDHPDRIAFSAAARAAIPWKKGPFRLFGEEIDAEWQSGHKWDRLKPHLPDLRDKLVLDVGCNNGYYMFRTMAQGPRFVLGIDPVPRFWYQFEMMRRPTALDCMELQLWGWQETAHFERIFDCIFCMGIVYHHQDPVQILKNLYGALKPGGHLVLESIVIDGPGTWCLFPQDRYARMRNVWFVPTVTALENFLVRTKFEDIRTVAVNKHEPVEQRTTEWNPGPSFADFIHKERPGETIEGHPAPWRALVLARKP